VGRPKIPADIRKLILEMSGTNPLWGAPRIHGELLKLGIDVGQTTVAFAQLLPRILQRESHASIAEEGCADSTRRPEGRTRARLPNLGWASSSVHPGLNIRQGQRRVVRFLVWVISAALRPRALLVADNLY